MTESKKDNYKETITVNKKDIRLDIFLSEHFDSLSRTKIKNFILDNRILINGKAESPSFILKGDEKIKCDFSIDEPSYKIKPENIDLDIIYEDDYLIVINKPSGLVVHPGNGIQNGTLVNALSFHFSKLSNVNKISPGIVHRLDKETSGAILIAKDDKTHWELSKQFEDRLVKKIYRAFVWGNIPTSGLIDGFIVRDRKNRTKFTLGSGERGRFSESKFSKIDYFAPLSYVEIYPKTGRTHQIRVHLESISHPIICDATYGGGIKRIKSYHMKYNNILKLIMKSINRVALHAYSIEITHPKTLEKMQFSAPIPDDFNFILETLGKN